MSLIAHIPPAVLVATRIGGLTFYAPVIGSSAIPAHVKALLALVLGAAIYPMLAARHEFPGGTELNLWLLAPLMVMEVLIGALIGFLASLPLSALQVGGVVISQQMGLSFGQIYNPQTGEDSDIVSQLLYFMAVAIFITCGGLDATLLALLHTFDRIPMGGVIEIGDIVPVITGLMISALELALRIAAPLLCIVFLETVALGFLSRSVPQLNVLSLGFPIRILVGLTALGLSATVINDVVLDEIDAGAAAISDWVDAQSRAVMPHD